ncbi:hypothetical protein H4582DRAFT_1986556, partial [Lactarius indigo]
MRRGEAEQGGLAFRHFPPYDAPRDTPKCERILLYSLSHLMIISTHFSDLSRCIFTSSTSTSSSTSQGKRPTYLLYVLPRFLASVPRSQDSSPVASLRRRTDSICEVRAGNSYILVPDSESWTQFGEVQNVAPGGRKGTKETLTGLHMQTQKV